MFIIFIPFPNYKTTASPDAPDPKCLIKYKEKIM
jgi:hypothetical protein